MEPDPALPDAAPYPADAVDDAPAHRSREEILAGLDWVRQSPARSGPVELIVRRPAPGMRELLSRAELDLKQGLRGDTWISEISQSTGSAGPDLNAQITLMNSRAATLVAGSERPRWANAGDQLYVDLDISLENLKAGATLTIGAAVLEVTDEPHLGCGKFTRRFGIDASKVFNSPEGRSLRLRGVNTRILVPGEVRIGDLVTLVAPREPS